MKNTHENERATNVIDGLEQILTGPDTETDNVSYSGSQLNRMLAKVVRLAIQDPKSGFKLVANNAQSRQAMKKTVLRLLKGNWRTIDTDPGGAWTQIMMTNGSILRICQER